MPQFDEAKQERRYEQLREQEEEQVMQLLSDKYGIPYIDLSATPISADALVVIKEPLARAAMVAAFNKTDKNIDLAVHSPDKEELRQVLSDLESRGLSATLFLASMKSLEFAWERYKDIAFTSESKHGLLDISGEDINAFITEVHSSSDVKKYIDEALSLKKTYRISRIAEVMVAGALATHSSDIHLEPQEADVRLRMRLDGILTDITTFDRETYRLLLSRIKLLSGLKLNVQQEAQDGRFSIRLNESDIEIRTSILPGQYGESIVMRILNPDTISVSIDKLGMRPDLEELIRAQIARPNGMILTTGPTGSGKTTTLYAFLKSVHTPDVKIITIEDPIEYHLAGIVQTQVDANKEYTFGSGLRAALRQDPDIIMVGEIRDAETAEIAVHAALTGHLVFSTLHTNSAAGAFTRLIDLGINPRVLGTSINVALAQRLVRKVCPQCRVQKPLEGKTRENMERILSGIFDQTKVAGLQRESVWEAGPGCQACGGFGYKGRLGIFEAVVMNSKVEEVVEMSPSEREIKKIAIEQGFLTMTQDAVLKVLEGVTTLDEVARVIDLTE